MNFLCKLAQWSLVGLTLISLLATFGQILPMLFFIAAIAVMFPPTQNLLSQKIPILEKGIVKFILWLVLVIIAGSQIETSLARCASTLKPIAQNVPELIAVVQKQNECSPAAAKTLGDLGNKQAVEPLIAALNTATDAEIRANAAQALGNLRDTRAVQPLMAKLKDPNSSVVKSVNGALKQLASTDPKIVTLLISDLKKDNSTTAQDVLVNIGTPAVDPLITTFQGGDLLTRRNTAQVLGQIGDARAIEPLRANLTNWSIRKSIGSALQALNWNPESDQDKIHFWIALGKADDLKANWATTKQVLLKDVSSGNPGLIDYGLYSFMAIGNSDTIPSLVSLLKQKSNKEIALAYLNCGEPTLEKAAQDWARANGYRIIRTKQAAPKVEWGNGL